MRHLLVHAAVAAAALVIAGSAQALTFQNASTSQGSVVTDYSGAGLISFDVDFAGFAPVTLRYGIDAADAAAGLDLNAVLRNLAGGVGFDGHTLALSQGQFTTVGSVWRQFSGTGAPVSANGGSATITFAPPEFTDVELGDPLGRAGAANWAIGGLAAGSTLEVTLAPVPEPGALALMLAGLGAVGFLARRSRPR